MIARTFIVHLLNKIVVSSYHTIRHTILKNITKILLLRNRSHDTIHHIITKYDSKENRSYVITITVHSINDPMTFWDRTLHYKETSPNN